MFETMSFIMSQYKKSKWGNFQNSNNFLIITKYTLLDLKMCYELSLQANSSR